MRIIITGGTGLIGSRISAELAEAGHQVYVLSRNPAKYTFPDGVEGVVWDSKTANGWGHLADGADIIINLAGASIAGEGFPPSRWTPERKRIILDSRINAGRAVVEAIEAAEEKPKLLLQASAVGIYGDRDDEKLTEDSAVGGGFLADVVKQWESSVSEAETLGVRVIYLRTGVVYSMEGGALPVTVMPFKLFAGGPMGNGKQYVPWIHIEDQIRAMLFLLSQPEASGVYNLSAPHPATNKAIAKTIGKVMGRPSIVPAPAFALRTLLGETADLVLDSQRVYPERLQQAGFAFEFAEVDAALMDLLNQ